jgi:hypothetical protein
METSALYSEVVILRDAIQNDNLKNNELEARKDREFELTLAAED